jgi:tripartite-type tricarboxylate transporter receptor subunit TctC
MIAKRLAVIAFAAVTFGMFGAATSSAEVYPSRPITIIVPFPAGGNADTVARLMADAMKTSLGQPILIENVPGAGGSIGVGRLARARPDGYTLDLGLLGDHVMNGALYPLQYDLQNDFEPISLISYFPFLIYAKKTMLANDLYGLIAWLKANPDKASQGITAVGTHLAGAVFQKETGTRFQFVPYRGAPGAIQDLLAGQIDLVWESPLHLPQVHAGSIKAFAVTSKTRLIAAPEIPTVDEAGFPSLGYSAWFAFFAPKGTPKEVIGKLNTAVGIALDDPAVLHRLAEQGHVAFPPEQRTPEVLGTLVKTDIEKWWPIIKAANIRGE